MKRRIELNWTTLTKLLTDAEMMLDKTTVETAETIENITLARPNRIIIDLKRTDKRKEQDER